MYKFKIGDKVEYIDHDAYYDKLFVRNVAYIILGITNEENLPGEELLEFGTALAACARRFKLYSKSSPLNALMKRIANSV